MLTNSCDLFCDFIQSTEKRQVPVRIRNRPTFFLVRKKAWRCLPVLSHCLGARSLRVSRGGGGGHPALVLSTRARPRITAAAHATLEALETRRCRRTMRL